MREYRGCAREEHVVKDEEPIGREAGEGLARVGDQAGDGVAVHMAADAGDVIAAGRVEEVERIDGQAGGERVSAGRGVGHQPGRRVRMAGGQGRGRAKARREFRETSHLQHPTGTPVIAGSCVRAGA